MKIEETIGNIKREAEAELMHAKSMKDVEALRVKYLGRKGPVQALMGELSKVEPSERPTLGQKINSFKESIAALLDEACLAKEQEEQKKRLGQEWIDITLPGRKRFLGNKHVVLKMLDEVIEILSGMGFSVQYGPEVESEYYNFEALNFAKDHPARDMQDTFYISKDILLRTHTSNTQVHVMEKSTPPIRIIAPGKCYRNEDISSRSFSVFHQVEGLYIDKNVTFTDLFSTMRELFTKLFQKELKMRFRPSYFPFVEPGTEVDIHCFVCDGVGCSVCKQSGWLEVSGAGMVHPEVLKNGGIDPEKYSGYAWGFGVERLAMLRYGVNDIRLFFDNNLQFLRQF